MEAASFSGDRNLMLLKSALLALEPVNCILSLARKSGDGYLTEGVQNFILEHCINDVAGRENVQNQKYVKNVLKSVIVDVESTSEVVVEALYEHFANFMTLRVEDDLRKGNNFLYKHVSFYLYDGDDNICSSSRNLMFPLRCSLNMLKGDTGCNLWPSGLFLSEFILSYPEIFSNSFCFEVGSGVGLVGISLAFVKASKVVLTDGDMSSLANLKSNLELNQLTVETKVECKHLLWETASEIELQSYRPQIVLQIYHIERYLVYSADLPHRKIIGLLSLQCLGSDVIYDPDSLPHLVRVLSTLLNPKKSRAHEPKESSTNDFGFTCNQEREGDPPPSPGKEAPIAYLATVIRNPETFNLFLSLASKAHLSVLEITCRRKPRNLLPYLLSYDRSGIHLYKLTFESK